MPVGAGIFSPGFRLSQWSTSTMLKASCRSTRLLLFIPDVQRLWSWSCRSWSPSEQQGWAAPLCKELGVGCLKPCL